MNSASRRVFVIAVAAAAALLWKGAASRYKNRRTAENRRGSRQSGEPVTVPLSPVSGAWNRVGEHRIFVRHAVPGKSAEKNAENLPVVMVHGFGVSGRYFIPVARRLACDFPVWIPDLPGHGRSSTPDRALGIPELAQVLLDWLDKAGVRRCVLVGQSMGAQIVVEAAERQSSRFAGLVLIGPTSDPSAGLLTHSWRLLQVAPYERLSLFVLITMDYLRMGLRLIPECRAMLNHPMARQLEKLNLPVMVMKGDHDAIVPDKWFEMVATNARSANIVVIANGGHAVQHSAPDQTAAVLRPYLRDLNNNEIQGSGRPEREKK